MALKFNPLTGNFDFTGSGGGGASYIDGEVAVYADLPLDGTAALNTAWLVRTASGVWPVTRHQAGIYIRTATGGSSRDADWTYAGTMPDVFSDANFTVYDDADTSKNLKFQLSGLTTGTTSTLTVPASGTIALTTTAPAAHAASHAAAGSDPVFNQDLNTTNDVEFNLITINGIIATSGIPGSSFPLNGEARVVDIASDFYADFAAIDNLTANRTYELPDASGTIALTTTAPASHAHGNLTNAGLVGTTSGLPLKTGTGGIVEAGAFGATSGTFAEGNDSRFHTRSHAVTSTSDHTAGNNMVFYSNGSGQLVELALGASGTILTSAGTTSAPTFSTPAAGGTKTYAVFAATDNQPPASAFATLDTRNSTATLDFDSATDENAVFVGITPEAASLGSGLIVRLHWMATTATSGNVRWGVQFERSNTDLDSDSFDTAVEATAAANATSGIITTTAITVTTIDGITAGDVFRLKVFRNADDATNDTMTGDAELVAVEIRSAA